MIKLEEMWDNAEVLMEQDDHDNQKNNTNKQKQKKIKIKKANKESLGCLPTMVCYELDKYKYKGSQNNGVDFASGEINMK